MTDIMAYLFTGFFICMFWVYNFMAFFLCLPVLFEDGNAVAFCFLAFMIVVDYFVFKGWIVGKIKRKLQDIVSDYAYLEKINVKRTGNAYLQPKRVNIIHEINQAVITWQQFNSEAINRINTIADKAQDLIQFNEEKIGIHHYFTILKKQKLLYELKVEYDYLTRQIFSSRIIVLETSKGNIKEIESVFTSLHSSKKLVFNNKDMSTTSLFPQSLPKDIKIFKYKNNPIVLFFNDCYFCIFEKVILIFDKGGNYQTAISSAGLNTSVKRSHELVYYRNNIASQQVHTDVDSKVISKGDTTTTWQYTRSDGLPDRRYSNNAAITIRTDILEYAQVYISIADFSLLCYTSSSNAINKLETLTQLFLPMEKNDNSSIYQLLSLVDMLNEENGEEGLGQKYSSCKEDMNLICKCELSENPPVLKSNQEVIAEDNFNKNNRKKSGKNKILIVILGVLLILVLLSSIIVNIRMDYSDQQFLEYVEENYDGMTYNELNDLFGNAKFKSVLVRAQYNKLIEGAEKLNKSTDVMSYEFSEGLALQYNAITNLASNGLIKIEKDDLVDMITLSIKAELIKIMEDLETLHFNWISDKAYFEIQVPNNSGYTIEAVSINFALNSEDNIVEVKQWRSNEVRNIKFDVTRYYESLPEGSSVTFGIEVSGVPVIEYP